MRARVSFYCPACNTKLKASECFVGQSCPCPKCRAAVVVPPRAPEEQAPVLVMDDGHRTRRARFR